MKNLILVSRPEFQLLSNGALGFPLSRVLHAENENAG
jgi:hypothetical protein